MVAGALVLVAAATVTLVVALSGDDDPAQPQGRTFAQYSYRFVAPGDWTQTGDNVADRQVVVKPNDAQQPTDDDLVVVQEFVLSYDAGSQRGRLADALRAEIEQRPDRFGQFQEHRQFAGKDAIYYVETKPAATVNWYVVANKTAQVSIGCQEAAKAQRVQAACEQIVRTLEFTN